MFSLHWWGSPHVIVRSEAEACHGHGSIALRQHSISSMCFVINRFGFPAGWMCTSNPIGHSLEQLCLKQHRNKSCIMGITCATQWWIPSFINSSVEFATQLQPYVALIERFSGRLSAETKWSSYTLWFHDSGCRLILTQESIMWGQIRLLRKLIWIVFNTHSGSHTDDRTHMGEQTQLKCEHAVCFSSWRAAFYQHTATLWACTENQNPHLLCARPRQLWRPCSTWCPSPRQAGGRPPWFWL